MYERDIEVFVDRILWKTWGMRQVYGVFAAGLLLTACAASPQLDPRPGGNPMQVDLSGNWVLRDGEAQPVAAEQTIRIPSTVNRTQKTGARSAAGPSRSRESSVHVFLESGSSLKVTQTDYGLFFSFNRAIVEEYNFGENRTVNVGPIEAQRVSGWQGASFMIETMDSRGNILTEAWSLDDNGKVLVRQLGISKRGEAGWSSRQVFDRE
jgi:hypothetical protein